MNPHTPRPSITRSRSRADEPPDDFIHPRNHPGHRVLWALTAIFAALLLVAQIKYSLVERYAQHAEYRGYLAGFCQLLACKLPPRRDAQRLTLTRARVDMHPHQPGAVRIAINLINEAPFAQPYPQLQLTLTDRAGRIVGRRTVAPEQYLAGRANRLRSGELGGATFDLARPHPKAVGFEVAVVGATEAQR